MRKPAFRHNNGLATSGKTADRLDGIRAAAAALDDPTLETLRRYGDEAYGKTAGLLAALAHAADWAWHGRQGIHFPLSPPEDAIEADELGACLEFLPALSQEFEHDLGIRTLLAEIGRALTAGTRH